VRGVLLAGIAAQHSASWHASRAVVGFAVGVKRKMVVSVLEEVIVGCELLYYGMRRKVRGSGRAEGPEIR
jgi:hypothetical protein